MHFLTEMDRSDQGAHHCRIGRSDESDICENYTSQHSSGTPRKVRTTQDSGINGKGLHPDENVSNFQRTFSQGSDDQSAIQESLCFIFVLL